MALVKRDQKSEVKKLPTFESLEEAISFYENTEAFDERSYALEEMAKFKGGTHFLVDKLIEHTTHKDTASRIAAILSQLDPKEAPIEQVMELLKLPNAYVRNLGISILQDYGKGLFKNKFFSFKINNCPTKHTKKICISNTFRK